MLTRNGCRGGPGPGSGGAGSAGHGLPRKRGQPGTGGHEKPPWALAVAEVAPTGVTGRVGAGPNTGPPPR
jgi:hypothetical protein